MSEASSTSPISLGDYAPSPNTCSMALTRANQLRVQALLRQLLISDGDQPKRLDTLRVLRRTVREFDYQFSWLTQVDFLETIERLLREENDHPVPTETSDRSEHDAWRLVNDSTQLLIEAIPRLPHELDTQTMNQILTSVIQNLGHQRSEVRRASLLLVNMYLNERPNYFQQVLKLFIDYGLANHRNSQAQKGAILSLPLLMTEQVVADQDLMPLIRCLSELLVDANGAQLFYSLYLALQRLHLTVGEPEFANYLRQCDPEATLLYKQAQSRQNSLAGSSVANQQLAIIQHHSQAGSRRTANSEQRRRASTMARISHGTDLEPADSSIHRRRSPEQVGSQSSEPKQVTFENAPSKSLQTGPQRAESGSASSSAGSLAADTDNDLGTDLESDFVEPEVSQKPHTSISIEEASGPNTNSSASSSSTGVNWRNKATQDRQFETPTTSRISSSVSSTCSSEANLVDPAHYMSKEALSGHPLSHYDQIHHVDHSNVGLAINDLAPSCSPTMELGPALQNELKFGIFPRHLVGAALSVSRHLDRMEALQEMMCIIRDSPINHLAILMTYFDSFLDQFLAPLMEPSSDFKVELIAIDMIETIIIKTKVSTMHYVRPIVGLLFKTLGDPRSSMFRESSVRVIHKMMAFLPPQHVIDAIFEHKHHKSGFVREECVNRITGAVLEYDKNEFNLTKLCYHVLPMLADHQAGVRLAALECIAALAQALGQERIGSLLTAAEAVQTGCDYDGLLEAIGARLRRRALPRCNPDGSIRFVIKPFLNLANANFHQEHKAADVRWVLEAPSSHQQVTVTAAGHLQHQAMFAAPTQTQTQTQAQHHLHRPGAYSPPSLAQQRRCSVSLSQLAGAEPELSRRRQHHHNHHQHQNSSSEHGHNSATKAAPANLNTVHQVDRDQAQISDGESASLAADSNEARRQRATRRSSVGRLDDNLSEISSRQSSAKLDAENLGRSSPDEANELHASQAGGDRQGNNEPLDDQPGQKRRKSVQHPISDRRLPASSSMRRRSISQESTSSTDTNKVLFQYYLSEFKQSLKESTSGRIVHSVLPSDSIIYTDTVQAYSLSRHNSRQQQTSFDYDSDSVGRVPTAANLIRGHNYNDSSQVESRHQVVKTKQQLREDRPDSSGSESPLTVMEADGSDRRPTLRADEQVDAARERRRRASGIQSQEKRNSKQASRDEEPQTGDNGRSAMGDRRKSVTRASQPEAEQVAGRSSRRQSIAGGHDQVTTGARLGVDGKFKSEPDDEADEQQRDKRDTGQHQKRADGGEPAGNRRSELDRLVRSEEQSSQQHSGSKRAGLVRQAASLAADAFATGSSSASSSGSSGSASTRPGEAMSNEVLSRRSSRLAASGVPAQDGHSRMEQSDGDNDKELASRQAGADTDQTSLARRESRRSRETQRSSSKSISQHEESAAEDQDPAGRGRCAERQLEADQAAARRRRSSRSQPPTVGRHHNQHPQQPHQVNRVTTGSNKPQLLGERVAHLETRRAVSVSPSVASHVNIRHILENVAEVEGSFQEPQLAFKVAIEALDGPCWSTKVEGILALIRLASHHEQLVLAHLHEVVGRTAEETRNLRSTVARSAIFALGDFCAKLKRNIEPELDTIVQALIQKSSESTGFIRDDIRRALATMLEHLTHWRLANALINHGANHKNGLVRRMASQFIAALVERMGAAKCLVGAREIGAHLLPVAAKFAQDGSPQTRFYGRLILSRLYQHGAFDRLLRKHLTPNLYRTTLGIIESVKRRGPGEPPPDG